VYRTCVDEDERAAGGSTILVRDNILYSYFNFNINEKYRSDGSVTVKSIAE
jgi:hypothetical protein